MTVTNNTKLIEEKITNTEVVLKEKTNYSEITSNFSIISHS